MKQNDCGGLCPQFSHEHVYNGKQRENLVSGRENLTRVESFVCCPDVKILELNGNDPAYRVVNINLKGCVTKLWNNMFKNLSIHPASFFDNSEALTSKSWHNCCVPGCYYEGERKQTTMKSLSETSKYDYRKSCWWHSEPIRAKKVKAALKYYILDKIAEPKICDGLLVELQHVLARFPFTDLHFYWDILRVIHAEIEVHKRTKGLVDECKYKIKTEQLHMLSYAITRLILQLYFITGGNPLLPFRGTKSCSQAVNYLKEDFPDPVTGKCTIKPFPRVARSRRRSTQDDANSDKGFGCLPFGLFSRVIGLSGPQEGIRCLTLKVDNFPDELTYFDLKSLTYLICNLNRSLQLEFIKGSSGKCRVPNCSYPTPVRNERIIKELKSSIRAIEQLLFYLRRLNSFKPTISSKVNGNQLPRGMLSSASIGCKSTFKNGRNLAEMKGEKGIEVDAYQVKKCLPHPHQDFPIDFRFCSPARVKNSRKPCIENEIDDGLNCKNFSQLRLKQIPPYKEEKVIDLCFTEPSKISSTKLKSKRSPEEANRSRLGASCCSPRSTADDSCEKCYQVSEDFRQYISKIREEESKNRRMSTGAYSDGECDFAFQVQKAHRERKIGGKSDACKVTSTSNFCRKTKVEDSALLLCCNQECVPEKQSKSSTTKLANEINPNSTILMCDQNKVFTKTEKTTDELLNCDPAPKLEECKNKCNKLCCEAESTLVEMDRLAIASKRGECSPCSFTACEVKRKASVGIQVSTSPENSFCNGQSAKLISDGSNPDRDMIEPSKPTKIIQSQSVRQSDNAQCSSLPCLPLSPALSLLLCSELHTELLESLCKKASIASKTMQLDCTESTKSYKSKRAGQDREAPSTKCRSPCRSRRSNSKDNMRTSPSQVRGLVNPRSIKCLQKNLESKCRSSSKEQGLLQKTRDACIRRQCFKCRVRKNSKCKRTGPHLRTCKSSENFHCTLNGCKSRNSSKLFSKSVPRVNSCAGYKSRACKMKCSRRIKSLSEVFSRRKDYCAVILGEKEVSGKKKCMKNRSHLLQCSSRNKSVARNLALKAQKTEDRLKDVSSELKKTKTKLRKYCTQ